MQKTNNDGPDMQRCIDRVRRRNELWREHIARYRARGNDPFNAIHRFEAKIQEILDAEFPDLVKYEKRR